MATLSRLFDFTPNTLIQSQQVDDEFNQLVTLLNGTSVGKDAQFAGSLKFTGNFTGEPNPRTGTPSPASMFRVLTPADFSLTADTENTLFQFGGNASATTQARTFAAAGGGFPLQRETRFIAPTYAFNSADTITDAIHVEIDTPRAGSNATLTNSYALKLVMNANAHQGLWIDNSQASPTGNLFIAGIGAVKIFRIVPSNGDLNFVFCDSALGTTNTDGFIHYPSCAGVPTGTPTLYTGVVPTVIDTTNSRFYGYIGGAWVNLSGAGGGSGTVNTGAQFEISFYPSAGTTVDGLANFLTDASGGLSHATSVRNASAPTFYNRIITPADTALTASTECVGIQFGGNTSAATVTRQWATGALTTEREYLFVHPTYGFVGASTLTNAATVAISGRPLAGANATITNAYALWVQSNGNDTDPMVRIDGALAANTTGAGLMVNGNASGGGGGTDGRLLFGYFDSSGFLFPAMWGGTNAASPSQTNFFFHYNQNSAEEAIFNGPGTSGTVSFRTNNNFTTPAIQVKSSTDGQVIGMNVAPASIGAQLHVASGATGRVGFRADSIANSTVDLATFNLNADDTNSVANMITFDAKSNGSVSSGFGCGFTWTLESSTTDAQTAATMRVKWFDATHASRTSAIVFGAVNSGTLADKWAVQGSGAFAGASGGSLGWSSSSTDPTLAIDTGFTRGAAGRVHTIAASGAVGALLRARYVLATAGTATLGLGTQDSSDGVFTNEGSTGLLTLNLPTATTGLTYTFYCQDADGIRVVAAAGDTIRLAGSVSASAGRIDSTTVGSTVILVAMNATEWVSISTEGTWVVT